MALSKTTDGSRNEVVALISPEQQRRVRMGVAEEAMGHILDRLTDMYPDPIKATVREVVSNAYDATVILPREEQKPVRVLIPSMLSADFIVEDFGVGMSLELVEEVYAQYGRSTKKDDFRTIGAYGLGAKAPLAYCTEFSGETTRDGVTTIFKVTRERLGNFTDIISSTFTGKPNGTRITIPARAKDAEQFKASVNVYRQYGFSVPLIVDEKRVKNSPYIELFNDVVLDEDANITGRMWLDSSHFEDILVRLLRGEEPEFAFELSGWRYDVPMSDHERRVQLQQRQMHYGWQQHRADPHALTPVLVELKPGVVDFSSSRDDVTLNDRSEKLVKALRTRLKSEEFKQRLLDEYRAKPDAEAQAIFDKLLNEAASLDAGRGKLVFQHPRGGTAGGSVGRADLVTKTGFDPGKIAFGAGEATVVGGFVVGDSVDMYCSYLTRDMHYHRQGVRDLPLNYSTAGTVKEMLEKDNKRGKGVFSLPLTVLQLKLDRRLGHNVQRPQRILVITDVPKGQEKNVVSWRSTMSKSEDFQHSLVLLARSGSDLDEDLKLIKAHKYSEPKVYDFDSMKRAINELRRVQRKPSATSDKIFAFHQNGSATVEDLLKNTAGVKAHVTVNELKAKNAVVLVGERTYESKYVLMGAINAGKDLLNKPIYYIQSVPGSKTVPAAVLELLKDHDLLLMDKNYPSRSKSVVEIVKTHAYYGATLNDELMKYSEEEAIENYLQDFSGGEWHRAAFHEFLVEQGEEEFAAVFSRVKDLQRRRSGVTFTEEQITARLGHDVAKHLIRYKRGCTPLYSTRAPITRKLFSTVVFRYAEQNFRPVDRVLVNHVYAMILNGEGEAAEAKAEEEKAAKLEAEKIAKAAEKVKKDQARRNAKAKA